MTIFHRFGRSCFSSATPWRSKRKRGAKRVHKKILLLVNKIDRGGIENVVISLLKNHNHKKYKVTICEMAQPTAASHQWERDYDVSILNCPVRPVTSFLYNFLKIIQEEHYDAVHIHRANYNSAALPLAISLFCGVRKRIVHLHTTGNSLGQNSIIKKCCSTLARITIKCVATDIVAVSRAVADSHFPHRNKKVLVIPNAVEAFPKLNKLQSKLLRESLQIPADAFVIGNHSRFDPVKNHNAIIGLAEYLRTNTKHEFRILLVGDGTCKESVQSRIRDLGLEDSFVFTGWREDVAALVSIMDVYFFPSLREGMPLSLLEAMSCGLPVVSTNIQANLEILPEGLKSYSFPTDNEIRGYRQIERLLGDDKTRGELAHIALAQSLKYNPAQMIKQIQTLLWD